MIINHQYMLPFPMYDIDNAKDGDLFWDMLTGNIYIYTNEWVKIS